MEFKLWAFISDGNFKWKNFIESVNEENNNSKIWSDIQGGKILQRDEGRKNKIQAKRVTF